MSFLAAAIPLDLFFSQRSAACEARRKVSGAPLIRTFHVPAAVINTNERVSPTAPARLARISSKQTSELTTRNIESRATNADEKERLKFHSFTGSSFCPMMKCLLWHVAVVNFVYGIYDACWLARVYHAKRFPLGEVTFRPDSYNMTLAVIDHDLVILINGVYTRHVYAWRTHGVYKNHAEI